MKKRFFLFSSVALAVLCWSCNDNRYDSNSASKDSTATSHDTMTPSTNATPTTPSVTITPLSKDDSMFVAEAAIGAMMEIESGNIAQQNAANQRVKDFAAMMVTDHTNGNRELMTLATTHGLTLPSSLPASMQKHIDGMKKMMGKAFDQHYISMMVDDHKEDLSKFKRASTNAASEDLRTWATNAIPVLQKHMDSIQAIKKMKM